MKNNDDTVMLELLESFHYNLQWLPWLISITDFDNNSNNLISY